MEQVPHGLRRGLCAYASAGLVCQTESLNDSQTDRLIGLTRARR